MEKKKKKKKTCTNGTDERSYIVSEELRLIGMVVDRIRRTLGPVEFCGVVDKIPVALVLPDDHVSHRAKHDCEFEKKVHAQSMHFRLTSHITANKARVASDDERLLAEPNDVV